MSSSRLYSVEAIILKRKNSGEADRILTAFTKEHGKIRVVAKGVRRITSRRGPHLEPFSHVRLFLYKGKTSWDIVTDAVAVDTFANIRTDLKRVSVAYYLCELVDSLLPEKQEHEDIFHLLVQTIMRLNDDTAQTSDDFTLDLLRKLGFISGDYALTSLEIRPYVERIIEHRLRSHRFLTQVEAAS